MEDMTKTAKNAADNSKYSKVEQRSFQLARIQTCTGEQAGKFLFCFLVHNTDKSVQVMHSIIKAK